MILIHTLFGWMIDGNDRLALFSKKNIGNRKYRKIEKYRRCK